MGAPTYGYSLDTKSGTAAANDARSAFDSSGWNVNFGQGTFSSGAAVPQWIWFAAAAGAALWLLKRKG